MGSFSEELARFVIGIKFEDLPEDVVHRVG
jgi:hypothetical protein